MVWGNRSSLKMFPPEIKIRDLRIRPATILAPMAGVTDTVFRRVIRSLGPCGLIMTEFTSAEGLTRKAARTLRYLYYDEDERPIAAQIFGADPRVMASAAALTEDLGFDQVDINLGCPVKKVVKCGGSGLLRDLPHLEKLLAAVRAAVRIPLTIKIRSGWDENNIVAVEVARRAEQIGIEAIDRRHNLLNIKFHKETRVDPARLMKIVSQSKGAQFTPAGVLLLPLDGVSASEILRGLQDKFESFQP